MRRFVESIPRALLPMGVTVGLTVLVLFIYVERLTDTAACMERAQFEMVLCEQPPSVGPFGLLVGTAIVISILIGLATARLQSRA